MTTLQLHKQKKKLEDQLLQLKFRLCNTVRDLQARCKHKTISRSTYNGIEHQCVKCDKWVK